MRRCDSKGHVINSMNGKIDESRHLRSLAERAARSVGDQLRAAFRSPMDKDFKRDAHDIVTLHDKAAEEKIVKVLLVDCPDSVIVGEEGGTRGAGRVEWHIDPIDGTSNFARGIALWCVSIAAVVDNTTIAGVVFDPVSGNLFHADLTGAWLGDDPIHVHAAGDEMRATIVSSFPNAKDTWLFGSTAFDAQARLIEAFQAVRNLGSGALNLAHVAAGWADATMGFYTNSWDIAAGGFILRQAGGKFYALERGLPVEPYFSAPDYYAIGGDVTYKTLSGVMQEWSAQYVPADMKTQA